MTEDAGHPQRLDDAARHVIDSHGYSFQFSVIRRAGELYSQGRSKWRLEVIEFPVEVRGSGTRIDFILRHADRNLVLVAECKRANPALSRWLFVKAPFYRLDHDYDKVLGESVQLHPDHAPVLAQVFKGAHLERVATLATEIKTNAKGDPSGKVRGEIEEATTQVMRGLNGLVEFYAAHPHQLDTRAVFFIPAVFTTAELLWTESDLSLADIADGTLPESPMTERRPHIWYAYHQSPMIRHRRGATAGFRDLGQAVEEYFARTIAVVSPEGIDNFLIWSSKHL